MKKEPIVNELPALEALNMSVTRGKTRVLSEVSFSIATGEVFALLGGNGAGKSTTLLALLGLLKLDKGEARVLDLLVTNHSAQVRAQIAYLPESAALYEHLSAYENLAYLLALTGITKSRADMDETLDKVALQHKARKQKVASYSKGMRQKTAIALALLRETPILLLDEPTSGLDPVAIDEFNRLTTNLATSGKTILMVTHDVYGACQVAHRIGLLKEGCLVANFERSENEKINTETVHAAFSKYAELSGSEFDNQHHNKAEPMPSDL